MKGTRIVGLGMPTTTSKFSPIRYLPRELEAAAVNEKGMDMAHFGLMTDEVSRRCQGETGMIGLEGTTVEQTRDMHDETFNYSVIKLIVSRFCS